MFKYYLIWALSDSHIKRILADNTNRGEECHNRTAAVVRVSKYHIILDTILRRVERIFSQSCRNEDTFAVTESTCRFNLRCNAADFFDKVDELKSLSVLNYSVL